MKFKSKITIYPVDIEQMIEEKLTASGINYAPNSIQPKMDYNQYGEEAEFAGYEIEVELGE